MKKKSSENVPVVRRNFFAILELNDIGVNIHVNNTILQRNLDLALIEDSDIVLGQLPVTTDADKDWSIF